MVYSMVHEDGGEEKGTKSCVCMVMLMLVIQLPMFVFTAIPYKQRAKVAGLNGAGL